VSGACRILATASAAWTSLNVTTHTFRKPIKPARRRADPPAAAILISARPDAWNDRFAVTMHSTRSAA
jgi:hypothetical protein